MKLWRVRLTEAAEADLKDILRFTTEQFGPVQSAIYRKTVLAAVSDLKHGPTVLGSKPRDDIRTSLRILHVARHRRRGRHLLIYMTDSKNVIEVLRILHDAMDLARHLPPSE